MMRILDQTFRDLLSAEIYNNKLKFGLQSLELFEEFFDCNYKKVMVNSIASNFLPYEICKTKGKDCILNSVKQKDNFLFRIRNSSEANFAHNEVQIFLSKAEPPLEQLEEYRVRQEIFEYHCKKQFWTSEKYCKQYSAISHFQLFDNIIFPINQIKRFMEKGYLYSTENWMKYLINLIKINFEEYIFSSEHSNSKVYRFLKDAKGIEGWLYGFEFYPDRIRKSLNAGDICLPDYFNIVFMKKNFQDDGNKPDYIYEYSSEILSLGIMGNPFFSRLVILYQLSQ